MTSNIARSMMLAAGLWLTAEEVHAADEVTKRAVAPSSSTIQQPMTTPGTAITSLTLEQQMAALQHQVQALQSQVALLQSILKVTATGGLAIVSVDTITIQAAKQIAIGAGANVSIQSNGSALVEGKGGLDLKGMPIKMNGGSKSVATVGSQVQVPGQPIGQITTGSGTILGN